MEIVIKIMSHIPEGWPRLVVVIIAVVIFIWSDAHQKFAKSKFEQKIVGRVMPLLQVRKLQLEVEKLKAAIPDATSSGAALDVRVESLLKKDEKEVVESNPPELKERIVSTLKGGLLFFAAGALITLLGQVQEFGGAGQLMRTLFGDLLAIVAFATLAAAIPSPSRSASMRRGFFVPFLAACVFSLVG